MTTPGRGHVSGSWWILVALTALAISLGIWLRLSILSVGSLWLDELWTLDAVSRSFKEMIGARLLVDQSPPLFTALTWLWLRVTGTYDAGTMRLLSTGLGSLAILAPLAGAVRLRSIRTALLIMATLSALSLFPVQYSVELRAYSTMIGLSTASTVVWAGLLSGDLPRAGRWIFLFAVTGALAGFAHYYGNLPYAAEFLLLIGTSLRARPRRPLYLLLAWVSLSVIPVCGWLVVTLGSFPNHAVAPPPSLAEINTWAEYAFSPVVTVIRGQPMGNVDGSGVLLLITVGLVISAGIVLGLRGSANGWARSPAVHIGTYAIIVVLASLAVAWVASLVRPPSMNARNLSALLPALFLAVACASTPSRNARTNRLTGAAVVGVWLFAAVALVGQFGVAAVAPPWQTEAGYRATVQILLASAHGEPPSALIGLELPWDWHGEWDAAVRAELGASPAESDDSAPLDVHWILNVQELRTSGLPTSSLIVFTDASDQRSVDLFSWVDEARDDCEQTVLGGPGFGAISLLRCPPGR